MIRIGNPEYAKTNGHFGLTTIRNHHAVVRGSTVRFRFKGKSGVPRDVELDDPKVARIIRRCQELPGETLFEYIDEDGSARAIASDDVNEYLRQISGADFTAKDFRTWAGTVLAAQTLAQCEKCTSTSQARKNIVMAIDCVAKRLGNTRAVCKKCYIHPIILESYADGRLTEILAGRRANHAGINSRRSLQQSAILKLLRTKPVVR